MKIIKILGTGCSKCKQRTALVEGVVKELGINATIEKVGVVFIFTGIYYVGIFAGFF